MEQLDLRYRKGHIFRFISVQGVSVLAVCRYKEGFKEGEKTHFF